MPRPFSVPVPLSRWPGAPGDAAVESWAAGLRPRGWARRVQSVTGAKPGTTAAETLRHPGRHPPPSAPAPPASRVCRGRQGRPPPPHPPAVSVPSPLPWGVSGSGCRGAGGGGSVRGGVQDPAFRGGTKLVTKVVQAGGGQRRVPPSPRHRGTPKCPGDLLGAGRGTPGEHRPAPPPRSPELRGWGGGRERHPPHPPKK